MNQNPGRIDPPAGNHPWLHWLFIAIITLLTFYSFRPALNNEFLKTWDDPIYVTKNKLLDSLSAKSVLKIFSLNTEMQKLSNNYHPVTTLSLAINHQIAALNPWSYYLTNIFIHILNSILVYLLVFLLLDHRKWPGFLVALLFAIHPMHVESVAWISERKDVLYTFFFIAGLITYFYYLKTNRIKYLAFAFLLFFLSVLSKAMAVVFPVVLILLDIYLKRKWSYRAILEKIPFFIISALFGMLAIRVQSQGAINEWQTFTVFQRMMHASYGYLNYLYKFILPSNLSAFYPYPFITEHGQLPLVFRIAPWFFLLVMAVSAASLFMKNRYLRVFGFGMMFYFITIVMVLQFLSVGKAITADRYAYIPYIGILFILASWCSFLTEDKRLALKIPGLAAVVLLLAGSVVFAMQARQRVAVWHDDIALWNDALNQFPDSRMNFIRIKRANLYFDNEDYHTAMKDYQVIVSLNPKDDDALERIGRIYGQHFHQLDSALICFNRGYQANPANISLLKNLGVAYGIKADYSRSLEFFLKAYQQDAGDTALNLNIATTYRALGNMEKSKEFERLSHRLK
ncbi:MAG: hypothetical protein WCK34_06245 [Bacteroidota bacterium]